MSLKEARSKAFEYTTLRDKDKNLNINEYLKEQELLKKISDKRTLKDICTQYANLHLSLKTDNENTKEAEKPRNNKNILIKTIQRKRRELEKWVNSK